MRLKRTPVRNAGRRKSFVGLRNPYNWRSMHERVFPATARRLVSARRSWTSVSPWNRRSLTNRGRHTRALRGYHMRMNPGRMGLSRAYNLDWLKKKSAARKIFGAMKRNWNKSRLRRSSTRGFAGAA